MRIKNYIQFNESMSDITKKFIDEVSGEIKKILEPSIEFFQDLNDIFINHEDEGRDFEYDGFYLSCGGSPIVPFGIDFSKSEIELDYDDVEYFINENGIRKYEKLLSGTIYAQFEILVNSNWKNSDIYKLLEEIHKRVDCFRIMVEFGGIWDDEDNWKKRTSLISMEYTKDDNVVTSVEAIRIIKKIDR